ncbi:hypothetical protein [Ralstonia sp. ASV6]|uniref:hypothetical protein n=1 Tax=Ralstonia sp. ASV6 TaxID=2795124 RepID=UPI0018ECA510|nr:hypothetical protein [Ralstonia sp. ASV6]
MRKQIIGLDFKRFYADPQFWPEDGDTYHDDTMLLVDGEAVVDIEPEKISDQAVVEIQSGWVDAIPDEISAGKVDMSLADYYALWQKRNSIQIRLIFECSEEVRDQVVAAAVAAGAKQVV